MSQNNLFAAVDMGASKTIVIVGDNVRKKGNLLGYGEAPSNGGVQRGVIVDNKAALDSLRTAFAAAERAAGAPREVRRSYFAVSGPHVIGQAETGLASIAAGRVTEDDIRRATADAYAVVSPPERCLLRLEPQAWRVDGRSVPDRGLGREGRKFEIEFWRTEADTSELSRFVSLAENIGAPVEKFIPGPLGSAVMAATVQERHEGVLTIDMGASLTDVILHRDGRILLAESLPFGGDDLTHELSQKLRMRPDDAEKLKCTLGNARLLPGQKGTRLLFTPGEGVIGGRNLRAEELHGPLEARLREVFEPLRNRIRIASQDGPPVSHCVLTGSAASLNGVGAFMEDALNMRCERLCDREWVERFTAPRHSTAHGVFELAFEEELLAVEEARKEAARRAKGLFRRIFGRL